MQRHEEELTELRGDFERQAREIEQKYEKKMRQLRDEMDLRRKTEIHEIEERKNGQINTLMKNHEKAFSDIKNYYNDITLNNLALINNLKDQVDDMKKREDRTIKQMNEVMAENKRLVEPLQKAREEVEDLRRQLANYEKDKTALAVWWIHFLDSNTLFTCAPVRVLLYCNYSIDEFELQNTKARLKILESEHKALKWEHDILEQRFEKVLNFTIL